MNRSFLAIVFVMLATACGSSSDTSGSAAASTPTAAPSPTPATVNIAESEFKIDLGSTTSVKKGSVTFVAVNQGKFPHDLHLQTQGSTSDVLALPVMKAGETQTMTVTLAPGTYTYFCAVGTHRAKGMEGTLTVTA